MLSAISIHALREEGDVALYVDQSLLSEISIHALREEGDRVFLLCQQLCEISIHALREEGDFWALSTSSPRSVFLSTPSARRATVTTLNYPRIIRKFLSTPSARRATRGTLHAVDGHQISIHALREEGDYSYAISHTGADKISIHALREEGDISQSHLHYGQILFLSTPSARRATTSAVDFPV